MKYILLVILSLGFIGCAPKIKTVFVEVNKCPQLVLLDEIDEVNVTIKNGHVKAEDLQAIGELIQNLRFDNEYYHYQVSEYNKEWADENKSNK